jgi:hypothetical protein
MFRYLSSHENHEPHFTDQEILWVLFSIAFHTLCYQAIVPFFSSLFSSSYREIRSQHEKVPSDKKAAHVLAEWDSRGVSTIHAIISSTLALYSVFYEGMWSNFQLKFSTEISDIATAFMLGYVLYDLVIVLKYWPKDYGMLAHHVVCVTQHGIVLAYDLCAIELGFIITELSTPFVNNRFFLEKCKSKGLLYKVNGIMIWLAFLLVRLPMIPFVPVMHYMHADQFSRFIPLGVLIYQYTLYITISFLNSYWFYRITLGMIKAIKGGSPTTKQE